jgi:alkaline phosphatase D
VRFGFGSCVGKEPWLDAATWAEVDGHARADFFLLLGDNHYANTTDAAKQRAAFIAHRSQPSFRALFQKIPLLAIWDDHDFGFNDSDNAQPGKDTALRTFTEFFANPAAASQMTLAFISGSRGARWISSCSMSATIAPRIKRSTTAQRRCSARNSSPG